MMKTMIKRVLSSLLFTVYFTLGWGQEYDPSTGNTHYPNGTIYLSNTPGFGQGPVVIGPQREDGSREAADCDENEDRCRELLEEAADSKKPTTPAPDDGGSGGSTGEGETTSQALQAEIRQYIAQYKIKPGVWLKANGKWSFMRDPKSWNSKIYSSWK